MAKSLAMASCSEKQRACVGWINKYFNDCVWNLSGEISFGLGMISLLCWGMAEIPQLITNFQTKSGHGVSLALLLTWVIGDVFNLVGCLLEPVTVSLFRFQPEVVHLTGCYLANYGLHGVAVAYPVLHGSGKPFCIHRSARSLASSGTPSCGGASYLGVRSGPSAGLAFHDSSSEDEGSPAHRHGAAARKKTTVSRSVSSTCLCVWITFSSG
ncbi:hypothetical protein B296_00044632 [Ensete ventricosum]|uniref:Uncharacterized protein n=1 Tax=Ensete ventricosum TaxID=4639 RepID=A0A426YB63_ENSVE|nr:hypothetical protein B296_00044632 [Ensete ventricosum]